MMEIFTNFVKELDQSVKPSSAILMLMENLSSSSSTIGMMQEFDEDLIHKIQLFLKGEEKYNFLSGIENVQLNIEVRRKYPTLMKILEASADPDGTLKKPVRYECSFSQERKVGVELSLIFSGHSVDKYRNRQARKPRGYASPKLRPT